MAIHLPDTRTISSFIFVQHFIYTKAAPPFRTNEFCTKSEIANFAIRTLYRTYSHVLSQKRAQKLKKN